MSVNPAIIPCLTYRNAPAAIDFLCNAFGFERHLVVADEQDPTVIHHAQLVRDGQMIMLSSHAIDSDFKTRARLLCPDDIGGITQSVYVVLDNVDEHVRQARRAGAQVIMEAADQDYGGRNYSARDCEGHVWSFGSYDPTTT